MGDPVAVPTIRNANWQAKLHDIGTVVEGLADVDQCIRTILLTPKGSVPQQPDFGSDVWRYIDWPIHEARPHLVRTALDSITRLEPRVELTSIAYDVDPNEPSKTLIRIGRRLRGANASPPPLVLEVVA